MRDYGTATWEGGDGECDHKAPDEAGQTDKPTAGQRDHPGRFAGPICHKYGARRIDQQLGLEKTPEEYIAKMVEVFRGVWRVLRDDGTLWLNLGDSYNSGTQFNHHSSGLGEDAVRYSEGSRDDWPGHRASAPGLKHKDLCGIPWRVALALQADGWYLRQDIIWHKPNPMPESVTDRCTKSHEYLFLLTKNPRYFYDAEAIKEPAQTAGNIGGFGGSVASARTMGVREPSGNEVYEKGSQYVRPETRNKRSVWTIPTKSFKDAHFATFPPKLIEPCILAGTSAKGACPECGAPWERVVEKVSTGKRYATGKSKAKNDAGLVTGFSGYDDGSSAPVYKTTGWRPTCKHDCRKTGDDGMYGQPEPIPCIVADIFMGSGTTVMVAAQNGRDYLGIELNPEYAEMARGRASQGETGVPVKEARKGQGSLWK